jgi:hypothetical protein
MFGFIVTVVESCRVMLLVHSDLNFFIEKREEQLDFILICNCCRVMLLVHSDLNFFYSNFIMFGFIVMRSC